MPRTGLKHFFIHSILFHLALGAIIALGALYLFDKKESGGGAGGRLEPIIVGVIDGETGEGDKVSELAPEPETAQKKSTNETAVAKIEPLPQNPEKEVVKEKTEVKTAAVEKKAEKMRNEEPEEQVENLTGTASSSETAANSDTGTAVTQEAVDESGEAAGQDAAGQLAYAAHTNARPDYKHNPKPAYPKSARRRGYEGMVLLRVFVLKDGKVGKIELAGPSGYSVLDESALKAVKDWVFIPGRQGGKEISSWVEVPIKYQLDSG